MGDDNATRAQAPDAVAALADPLCRWVREKRLEAPAALFLAMHRPLLPLAWPAAVLCGPFLAPLVGPDYYAQIEALRDPSVLDRVLERLTPSAPRAAGRGNPNTQCPNPTEPRRGETPNDPRRPAPRPRPNASRFGTRSVGRGGLFRVLGFDTRTWRRLRPRFSAGAGAGEAGA